MEVEQQLFEEAPKGTELVTVEKVNTHLEAVRGAAEDFKKIAAALPTLQQQHPSNVLLDMSVAENRRIAKAAYDAWRAPRIAVENTRKAAKAPVLDLGKAIDAYSKSLEKQLRDGEEHYGNQITQWEAEQAKKEQERIDSHRAGIAKIRSFVQSAQGLPASRVRVGVERLEAMKFGPDWEEFANEAFTAQQETLLALRRVLAETEAKERESAEAEQRRLAVEKQARELAAQAEAMQAQQAAAQRQTDIMSALQGLQQQVIIAVAGRLGVRVGGTIQCLRDTLAETEAWTIDEAQFGDLVGVAQMTKDSVLAKIREILAARLAEEALATPPAPAPSHPPDGTPVVELHEPAERVVSHEEFVGALDEIVERLAPSPLAPAAAEPPAPAENEDATMNIGEMVKELGFQITSEFVEETLGLPPRRVLRRAHLYFPSDFWHVCDKLVRHVLSVQSTYTSKNT